jgi:hypothetical protein
VHAAAGDHRRPGAHTIMAVYSGGGTHQIAACYSGDPNDNKSHTSALAQVVNS